MVVTVSSWRGTSWRAVGPFASHCSGRATVSKETLPPWRRAGSGEIGDLAPESLRGAGLVVDAIFGAGLARPLEGAVQETVLALNGSGTAVIAVDVPSRLHGDLAHTPDGPESMAVRANLSVTFFRKKPAHVLMPGRIWCGDIVVAAIGISRRRAAEHPAPGYSRTTLVFAEPTFPGRSRSDTNMRVAMQSSSAVRHMLRARHAWRRGQQCEAGPVSQASPVPLMPFLSLPRR